MSARTRRTILFAILAGMLGLVVLDRASGDDPVRASNRPVPDTRSADARTDGSSRTEAGENPQLPALPERAYLGASRAELFSSQSWQPPAPAIRAEPQAPVAPPMPPMPYKYAGKLVRGGDVSILLSRGDTVFFPVKEGETLDGAYRVGTIGDTQLTLIYLPLGRKESIPIVSLLPVGRPVAGAGSTATPGETQAAPAATAVTQGPAADQAAPSNTAAGPAAGPARAASAPIPTSSVVGTDPGAAKQPARLLWAGPQQVKLGARFDVALRVTSSQPLHASPMLLRFDPAYLEFVAAKPGKFFGGGDRIFSYRANPDGSIFVGASGQAAMSAADAELLVLTFRPLKSAPAAELSVASMSLQGATGQAIAFGQPEAFRTAIAP
jgi:hypothetical protein